MLIEAGRGGANGEWMQEWRNRLRWVMLVRDERPGMSVHLLVRRQGIGISRSRQIFRARKSLISRWRGTVEDLRVWRLR